MDKIKEMTDKIRKLIQEFKNKDAIVWCDKVLEIEPRNVEALQYKAFALSDLARYDEAIKYYDKLIEIDPTNEICLLNRGSVLYTLNRFEEALSWWEIALKKDPTISRRFLVEVMLSNQDRYDEKMIVCNLILKHEPDNKMALSSKAGILVKLGKYEEALLCYDGVLKLDPSDRGALYEKSRIKCIMGNIDESLSLLERAVKLEPTLKDIKKARTAVQKLKEDVFDRIQGVTHSIVLYRELAKNDSAFDKMKNDKRFAKIMES